MRQLKIIKIDNSKKSAVKNGKWKNPGAKFYDTLMDAMWCEGDIPASPEIMDEKIKEGKYYHYDKFLKEAYLVGPDKDHKNSPYGRTPFARSGCKYPHHVIKGDKMVVSIPGLRSAYICARNQGCFDPDPSKRPEYSRTLVTHINRHLKELGLKAEWHHGELFFVEETDIKIEQNFHNIYSFIMEKTGINLFDQVDVFEEKRGNDPEYNVKKNIAELKRRFNFTQDGSNPNKGFIEVEGERYFIDLDVNDPNVIIYDGKITKRIPRATCTSDIKYKNCFIIIFDKKSLMSSSFNNVLISLYHEIGHIEVQLKKKFGSFDEWQRSKLRKQVSKRHVNRGHSNIDEYEADRYAANRVNISMRSHLTKMYDNDLKTKNIRNDIKEINKSRAQIEAAEKRCEIVLEGKDLFDKIVDWMYENPDVIIRNGIKFNPRSDEFAYWTVYMSYLLYLKSSNKLEYDREYNEYKKLYEKSLQERSKNLSPSGLDKVKKARIKRYSNDIGPRRSALKDKSLMNSNYYKPRTESTMSNEAIVLNSNTKKEIGTTPEEIYEWMHSNIQYDDTENGWKLRTPSEVYIDKKGNCHDQALFEAFHFHSLNIVNGQLFFIEFSKDNPTGGRTHTLTWFREGGNGYSDFKEPYDEANAYHSPYEYYWFENAWEDQAGIHGPYADLDELKDAVLEACKKDHSDNCDGIVFGNTTNYRCGMNLNEYVESWRLKDDHLFEDKPIEEQITEGMDWIRQFVHNDEFRESAIDESSKLYTESILSPSFLEKIGKDINEDEVIDRNNQLATKDKIDIFTSGDFDQYKISDEEFEEVLNRSIDEQITEAYTLNNLPDKMYFGTPNKISGKTISARSPRGLFLTPYIGIASMFIIDISKELDDYMSDILKKNGRELVHHSCNIEYDEWDLDGKDLKKPLTKTHMSHNIPEFTEVKDGTAKGYIYQIDVSKIKNQLQTYVTDDPDREVIYKGEDKLPITGVMEHTIDWTLRYKSNGQKGTFETKVIKESVDDYTDDELIETFEETCDDLYNIINTDNIYYTERSSIQSRNDFLKRWKYNSEYTTIEYEGIKFLFDPYTEKESYKFKYKVLGKDIVKEEKKEIAAVFIIPGVGDLISVNKDFWNLLPEEQDAVILHEIGHIVCQRTKRPFPKSIKEFIERIKKAIQRLIARIRMIKYAPGVHGNPFHELEADMYAMQRVSPEALKSALSKIYGSNIDMKTAEEMARKTYKDKEIRNMYIKYTKKHPEKNITYEQFKAMYIKTGAKKIYNKIQWELKFNTDLKQRLRAADDKKLRNSKYFKKESGDDIMYECGFHEGTGIDGDDLDWIEKYLMEEGENTDEQQAVEEPKPEKQSMPKQTDAAESDKNGVRRKKLYIAFIEWCKEYNPKNTFGSIFDKDAFHISYPFVPDEMRYFYRLANPILCVLGGELTFFQVSELRKLNAKNSRMNEMMIFAATPNDMRVFNRKDKKVYRGTEENGVLKLNETLGDTFDIYIQKMIKKGDILNGPIEEATEFEW